MNRICLLFFLCIISSEACFPQAYEWAWARGAGSNFLPPAATGNQVATDSSENLYICGEYAYNISFGPYNLNGEVSSFVAKYDKYGDIKWAKGDSSATNFDESGAN